MQYGSRHDASNLSHSEALQNSPNLTACRIITEALSMTRKRVEGKVALITGAAQGIGKATAIALAKEGAQIIISDVNDSEGNAVAREIGNNCIYLHLDVKHENEWET